jgi:hypothetical protein
MHTTDFSRNACGMVLYSGLLLGSCNVHAQTDADNEHWRFQVTPYLWMMGLKGNLQLSPSLPKAHVSQSFSDVLGDLDAALFFSGTARRGRLVVQADASYAALSRQANVTYGLQAHTKIQQTSLTVTGGTQWQLSPQDSVDAMAGARGWHLRSSLHVPTLLSAHVNRSFIDPIVALRWRHAWSDRWSSLLYADAGGWGVGSKFTWQLMGTINYQWKDAIYLSAGYRQLNVDYRHSHQRLDLRMGGPIVGVTFRF